jgi:uncharacterized protein YgfB (UPF0149 family)
VGTRGIDRDLQYELGMELRASGATLAAAVLTSSRMHFQIAETGVLLTLFLPDDPTPVFPAAEISDAIAKAAEALWGIKTEVILRLEPVR